MASIKSEFLHSYSTQSFHSHAPRKRVRHMPPSGVTHATIHRAPSDTHTHGHATCNPMWRCEPSESAFSDTRCRVSRSGEHERTTDMLCLCTRQHDSTVQTSHITQVLRAARGWRENNTRRGAVTTALQSSVRKVPTIVYRVSPHLLQAAANPSMQPRCAGMHACARRTQRGAQARHRMIGGLIGPGRAWAGSYSANALAFGHGDVAMGFRLAYLPTGTKTRRPPPSPPSSCFLSSPPRRSRRSPPRSSP